MKRFLSTALCALLVGAFLTDTGQASGLRQTHPAKQVPSKINRAGTYNEYPWFSHDGKLMFWTREDPAGSPQKLFVVYIQNWDALFNAPPEGPGAELPDLVVGTYTKVDAINDWVAQNLVAAPGQKPVELRSYAICHEPGEEGPFNQPAHNRWRYRFSLYFAARSPAGGAPPGKLWRAHNLIADVDKTTFNITINSNNLTFTEAVPVVTNPWDPSIVINETEPFFSRDSRYFFWAGSYGFGGMSLESHHVGAYDGCTQLMQAPKAYSTLPTSGTSPRFFWKDQYPETAYTNYHTLVEMGNGRTALIFEQCRGQVVGARESWCLANNDNLSTTGFTANGVPSNLFSDPSTRWWDPKFDIHKATGNVRATHPAISGRQNLADGTWILFYMQGKKLLYTKIKHQP